MKHPLLLLVLNALAATVTLVGAGIILLSSFGFNDPTAVAYAQFYAVRGIILSAAVLVVLARGSRGTLMTVLVIAGLVQLADIPIAAVQGNIAVVIAAPIIGLVHLVSVWYLARQNPS